MAPPLKPSTIMKVKRRKLTVEFTLSEEDGDLAADKLQLEAMRNFTLSYENWVGQLFGMADSGQDVICNGRVTIAWRTVRDEIEYNGIDLDEE